MGIKHPAISPAHVKGALGPIEVTTHILSLLGVVAGKTPVLPGSGKIFKLIRGNLMVGSVPGLFPFVVDRWPRYGPAPRGENFPGIFFPKNPDDLVEPVNAPVPQGAVGVIEKHAKSLGMDGPE